LSILLHAVAVAKVLKNAGNVVVIPEKIRGGSDSGVTG